jgi:hypothetical protein
MTTSNQESGSGSFCTSASCQSIAGRGTGRDRLRHGDHAWVHVHAGHGSRRSDPFGAHPRDHAGATGGIQYPLIGADPRHIDDAQRPRGKDRRNEVVLVHLGGPISHLPS